MNPIYREMQETDINAVLEISSLQFGPSYLNKKDLLHYLNDPKTCIDLVLNGKIIIGYSIIHKVEKSELNQYLNFKENKDFGAINSRACIQLRKTTAIHPDYVGKGLGTKFVRYTMNLHSKECDIIMSVNWKRKKTIPMSFIAQRLGMKEFVEINNYWRDKSIASNFNCPECGKPPCLCSAVIFMKEIARIESDLI